MSTNESHWSEYSTRPTTDDVWQEEFAHRVAVRRIFVAIFMLLFILALWLTAIKTPVGQLLDTMAMQAIRDRLDFAGPITMQFSSVVNETTIIGAAVLAFAATAIRKRISLGLRIVAMLVVANVLTQVLKASIERPDFQVGHSLENSFPSGHVAVVASLAVALVAAVPLRFRRVASVFGFLLASIASVAVIALGWHRPSDVLGSLAIVFFSAMAILSAEWDPEHDGTLTAVPAALGTVGLLVSFGIVGFVAADAPYSGDPVSQDQIVELAALSSPGLLLALAAFLACVSLSGLLFASVESLAGSLRR